MPTYDYRCEACRKEFSVTQSMSERDRKQNRCPECGSDQVTQLFSPFFAKTSRKS